MKTVSGQSIATDLVMRDRCSTCQTLIARRYIAEHRRDCLQRLKSDPQFAVDVILERFFIHAQRVDLVTKDERATWAAERDLCFMVIHIQARRGVRALFLPEEIEALEECAQLDYERRNLAHEPKVARVFLPKRASRDRKWRALGDK